MLRKTLYICLEVKHRELDSQILLAAKAVGEGYRVYLGTHAAIYALLKSKSAKAGILFDKSFQPKQTMVWTKKYIDSICILDPELSPAIPLNQVNIEARERIDLESIGLVDKFFVTGLEMYKNCSQIFKEDKGKVIHSGWPRIEMWKKYSSKIYSDEIVKLKREFGEYILFASSFNDIVDPNKALKLRKSFMPLTTPFLNLETRRLRFKNFQKMLQILHSLESISTAPNIILRPHPAEPVRVWKKSLRGLKKVKIITEGEVTKWLLASNGLLHNGSTVSIQAHFNGIPAIYIPEVSDPVHTATAMQISPKFFHQSPQALSFESMLTNNLDYKPQIVKGLVGELGHSPLTIIVKELNSLLCDLEEEHKILRLWRSQASLKSVRRCLGLLRDEIYWRIGVSNIQPQLRVVPWGIQKKEIYKVLEATNAKEQIKLRHMSLNLWEFERTESRIG